MNRSARIFCFLVLTLAAMVGCSSKPSAQESKKAETAPDKIQGKAQVLVESGGASDAALNSVDLPCTFGKARIATACLEDGHRGSPRDEYIAEGVYAQKAIDELGDPDQGKNGYPLQSSCERVVRMAWSGLPSMQSMRLPRFCAPG